jgi:cyclophilin family peptidyl-prolyl cis-trans isomerase
MRFGYTRFGTLLALLGFLMITGCGEGDEESSETPTVSIDGSSNGTDGKRADGSAEPKEDRLHPLVRIETSYGDITVKLDAEKAKLTVGNFLDYVAKKHYDNTIFHQVYRGQGIVGGGFTPELSEKAANTFVYNEAREGLKNRRGTIAMARRPDDIHSAACQFFLNVADNPELDHKDRTLEGYGYCVFGEVVEGMEVVEKIGGCEVRDTDDFERIPVRTVLIKTVRKIR